MRGHSTTRRKVGDSLITERVSRKRKPHLKRGLREFATSFGVPD